MINAFIPKFAPINLLLQYCCSNIAAQILLLQFSYRTSFAIELALAIELAIE
jgi:predicted neutral ceramidase superfamily lipid hydrolase